MFVTKVETLRYCLRTERVEMVSGTKIRMISSNDPEKGDHN